MPRWFVPRNALSVPQRAAVELSPERHRVVTGPPGSGKSLVLLHRARWLVDRWRVPPERLRVLCYTNALRAYLQAACPLVGLPPACVETFHNWCRRQWEAAFPAQAAEFGQSHVLLDIAYTYRFPRHRSDQPLRGSFLREMVEDVRDAVNDGVRPEPLDAALVDEGQDLPEAAYEILARAARHVTVALDYKQQIFEEGASLAEITRRLGVRARDVALLEAFRCSPHLLQLAARFVDDAAERERLLAQGRADPKGAETPLLYRAASEEDEAEQLAKVLKARLALGEHVGILVATRRLVEEVAEDLGKRGIDVEVPPPRNGNGSDSSKGTPSGRTRAHDFAGTAPKVMPYPSAKGLTFDSVLLPHLVSGAFRWYSAARLRKTLFVALTRARGWAYLGTVQGREASVLREEGLMDPLPFLAVRKARGVELFEESVEDDEIEERVAPPRAVRKDAIDELL